MAGSPFPSFQAASDAALSFLQEHYPMGLWMVTRTSGDDWIVLQAKDRSYDVTDGDLFRWSDSFCSRMVKGHAPNIAPDSQQIPAYASAPIGQQIPIASYIGFPLEADGELFGTLCAIDTVRKPTELTQADDLIGLLARMLSTILETDMRANRLSSLAQRLADAAHRDGLTEVLNRRGWDRLMALAETNRVTYGQSHCVVIADLDGLKAVNDQQGHAVGDRLLGRVARTLVAACGEPDIVARLGGDEFAVLLSEPGALDPSSYVLEVRDQLADAGISAAVGFATSGPTVSPQQAMREADLRMYEDKRTRA